MDDPFPLTSAQLVRYIDAAGENDHIDAKRPVTWDGAAESAALAKDIAAFANSRDGGVLVIGKSEITPGQFELTGLTEKEAGSFDQTKISTWINKRFEPPIRFTCHRVEHHGKIFAVITVVEFADVPHLCVKTVCRDPQQIDCCAGVA